MGDPADSLSRLMQSRGSDFFRNNDDAAATDALRHDQASMRARQAPRQA